MAEEVTIDTLYADIVGLRAALDDALVRGTRNDCRMTIEFHDGPDFGELRQRVRRLHADAYKLSPRAQETAAILTAS